jgi:CBS domain-containing protein
MKDIFKVAQVVNASNRIVSVKPKQKLRDTLKQLINNDYSQTPVVSADGFEGMVSIESIVKGLYDLNLKELDLHTDKFMEDAKNMANAEDDIIDHLDRLAHSNYVVVRNDKGLLNMFTSYDLINYFREFSEGFLLIQRIELILREIIKCCLDTTEIFRKAVQGSIKNSPDAVRSVDDLSFEHYRLIMTSRNNWHHFSAIFPTEDRDYVSRKLESARKIRNEALHFRRIMTKSDRESLKRCKKYFENKFVYLRSTETV